MQPHSYSLATYADPRGGPRAGIVVDERIVDLGAALEAIGIPSASPATSVLDVLRRWSELHPVLRRIARGSRGGEYEKQALALSGVRLLAPVPQPGAIFCAGANYRDHVSEMTKALNLPTEPDPRERGLKPWHFIKASSCVCAPGSRISLPSYSSKVDWEAEIGAVIGRECRNAGVNEAMEYVAGLTIVNDLSARDHLRRDGVAAESPFRFDWLSAKSFEGALPMGPWIRPLDEFEDVGNLAIQLWLNDELMQDSSSAHMIFPIAEQIAHLSTRLTLQTGDVIATGTPAGVGAARDRFLRPGDRIRIRVAGVGELVNEFAD